MPTHRVFFLCLASLLVFSGCGGGDQSSSSASASPDRTFQYVVGAPDAPAGRWTVELTSGGLLTVSQQVGDETKSLGSHFLTDDETREIWKRIDRTPLEFPTDAPPEPPPGAVIISLQQAGRTQTAAPSAAALSPDTPLAALQAELRRLIEKHAGQTLPSWRHMSPTA